MRSFRTKVVAACAWAIPALTAVLPRDSISAWKPLLELDLQKEYAQATFSVPCSDCLGHDDSLLLNFRTHSAEDTCGSTNITVNGVYLPQEWNGNFASGTGSFSSVADLERNVWPQLHDLDLEWQTACLTPNQGTIGTDDNAEGAAQVLTVVIKSIDGKPLHKPAGFTISFKPSSPPELLRLASSPFPSASEDANAQAWRVPPAEFRLVPATISEDLSSSEPSSSEALSQPSLEEEVSELQALQAEIQDLERAIKEKKKQIHSHLQEESSSLREELRQCDNFTCIVKAISHKAHDACKLLYTSFRPGDRNRQQFKMGRPNDEYTPLRQPSESAEATNEMDHPLPPRPADSSSKPIHIIVLGIVVSMLSCGCLVGVVRHRCSSPRSSTESATVNEQGHNTQPHKRFPKKRVWRRWWRRSYRDQERINDYEEKRALISDQESRLEDVLQEEIRQLRNAHGMVNSLVQAEEGRLISSHYNDRRNYHYHHHHSHHPNHYPDPPSPTSSAYTSNSLAGLASRPLSRTSSLPSYHSDTDSSTGPPAYESEDDMPNVVVDGFAQYRPFTYTRSRASSNESRWTPDSSIVDVSPRFSLDTTRYFESTRSSMGDVETRDIRYHGA